MSYKEITACRISGSSRLVPVLSLGEQALTGVFPSSTESPVTSGPLELAWCPDSGLLQLRHSYDPEEMYGDHYGYRSGLNRSMVDHLSAKIERLEQIVALVHGDVVLDIGSNDGTTLKAYRAAGIKRIGIDPTGRKFASFYTGDITLVPEFFCADAYWRCQSRAAKVVTSIAMFYDLEDPAKFVQEVENVLADDGIWHFEQS